MKYLLPSILLIGNLQASELKLVGRSLLEYSIFKIDIYEISFYRSSDNSEEIHLDYKVNVEKKHSLTGWNRSLEHITKKDSEILKKLNWILKNTENYITGDKVILKRNKNFVSISKNSKLISSIEDSDIASIIFEPWIGSKPINDNIKKELLGDKS